MTWIPGTESPVNFVPRPRSAVWPIETFRVGPMGAFGAWRRKPSDGHCPRRGGRARASNAQLEMIANALDYPCQHFGVDLSAPKGTPVYAPHDGYILYAGPAGRAPFKGYEPDVVLLAHADYKEPSLWERMRAPLWDIGDPDPVSARYSLLGHVTLKNEITDWWPDRVIDLGPRRKDEPFIALPDDVYKASSASKKSGGPWVKLADGTVVMTTSADAVASTWRGNNSNGRWVRAGDLLGVVSGANHVHWEIRTSPLAGTSGRIDPVEIWETHYGRRVPDTSEVAPAAPPPPSSGGGAFWLLALLALSGGKRKRGGGRGRRR